jgi:hypothetical protein
MAESVTATVSPWFRAGRRRNGCTSGAVERRSGRELWFGFLSGVGVVGVRVLLVVVVVP